MKEKLVNIVVEGRKDAYFLHEFLCHRFCHVLAPIYHEPSSGLSYKDNEKFEFRDKRAGKDVLYSIKVNYGFNNWGGLKTFLSDTDSQRVLTCVAIVFDSDVAGAGDSAGQTWRRGLLTKKVDQYLKELKAEGVAATNKYRIFLFPDNKRDGDLESVLASIARSRHRLYFAICWPIFQLVLSVCTYLRLSKKTMIYNYIEAMYEKTNKVAKIKDFHGYDMNMRADGLWNWDSHFLDKLSNFVEDLLESV